MQPQCDGEDCCGNGIGDYSCYPIGWINQCSIGYYVSDRCTTNFLFRIKKDGVVIEGPLVAKSFSFTPPFGEVADYTIEYCEGVSEPCTWKTLVATTEVDTTAEDACPMGIYGQTYVVGLRQSDNTVLPSGLYIYCQSSLVVRVSALCFSFGQKITHLWIDDQLWTPNTTGAGAIATESFDEPLSYSFMCHSGRDYAHTDTPWNDTTLPQIRIPLPIAFTKGSCSVRARQTNGMIIGCTVDFTCTAHYNAASVTLPGWEGMSSTCSATSGAPPGWGGDPTPVAYWGQSFETSIDIVPDTSGGIFSWYTCDDGTVRSMVAVTCSCTYNFKLSGLVRWVNNADSIPRTVYSGTFDYDHTVTWTMKLVLFASYSPGALTVDSLIAVVTDDAVSTFTGYDDYLDLAINSVPSGWSDQYNASYGGAIYQGTSEWFEATLVNPLECTTPYDGDVFQWNWIGPSFPSSYWELWSSEYLGGAFTLAPSQLGSGTFGSSPLSGTWPADTNFDCDLPEGGYYAVTGSATAEQFQL